MTKKEFNKMFPLKKTEIYGNDYGRISKVKEERIFTKYIRDKFWELLTKSASKK